MPIPPVSFHNKKIRIINSHHPVADGVVGIARHNGWFGGSGPINLQSLDSLLTEAHYEVEVADSGGAIKVENLIFSESQLELA